ATSARLSNPAAIAVDRAGNLFIADTGNRRIRRVTPDGIINTFAGNGTQNFSGDGEPATSAGLGDISSIAVDGPGNLFIAGSGRIRKVSLDGIITTVAGNGTQGFSGDGGPATSAAFGYAPGIAVNETGNLYIADSDNHRIRKVAFPQTAVTFSVSD